MERVKLVKSKTYFIADIAANHDGSLITKKLIKLAAESGANAVKFQHFKANTIVSISDPVKRER